MLPPQSAPSGQSSWPFERPEQLADALREQGIAPDEMDDLLPTAQRLAEWRVAPASPAETHRLLAQLAPQVLGLSPTRQAIRARAQRPVGGVATISWLLEIARMQVSLFGLAFWLVSSLVTLIGAVAVLSNANAALTYQELLLWACGPLLAYLGTVVAFRGTRDHVLEFELACLPSPMQLALARLVIVLGYDLALGLALCLALLAGGAGQVLTLMLCWLMPLLLVAGLALLLSLRLSIQVAAAAAYGSWLILLTLNTASPLQSLLLTPLSNALLGALGVALLAIALLRLRADMPRLLPHA